MTPTREEIQALRDGCEGVTPFGDHDLMRYEHGGGRLALLPAGLVGGRRLIADFYHEADREHFTRCTPEFIRALCDLALSRLDGGVAADLPEYWPATVSALQGQIAELRAERDAAILQVSEWARRSGEAEGALHASELAGVVEGWKARAESAEALLAEAPKRMLDLRESDMLANEPPLYVKGYEQGVEEARATLRKLTEER